MAHLVWTIMSSHQRIINDFEAKGQLGSVAARIVLKALYMARLNRPDLLWTVNQLAREVTKWNVACDKRLHRLMSYIHHNKNDILTSYVSSTVELAWSSISRLALGERKP